MEKKTIIIPGAVWCYLTGTSMMQGQIYSHDEREESAARRLAHALNHEVIIRRMGKGESYRITIDRDASWVLWDYADSCEDSAYGGDGPTSETYAAKKLKERIDAAFGTPPRFGDWPE